MAYYVDAARKATASEIRQDFAETVNRIAYRDESIVIERRGRPMAALISYKAFRLFQHLLEQLEDKIDAAAVKATASDDLLDFDVVVKGIRDEGGAVPDQDPSERGTRSRTSG